RHAVTVRSTSLNRASMSSVSLYLSTFILTSEPRESTRHHPDRQANGVTLPYIQLHTSCASIARFLQTCDSCMVPTPRRGLRSRIGTGRRGHPAPISAPRQGLLRWNGWWRRSPHSDPCDRRDAGDRSRPRRLRDRSCFG